MAGLLTRLRARFGRPPVPLVLYTRADCGLCDEMKDEIGRARLGREIALEEVDVATDAKLEERYGRSLPVLLIGGRLAFKGRLTAGELRSKFARLAAEWDRAQAFRSVLDEVRDGHARVRGPGAGSRPPDDERDRREER